MNSRFSPYARSQSESPYFSSGVTLLPALSEPIQSVVPGTPSAAANLTTVRRLFIDNRDRYGFPAAPAFDFKVFFGNDPGRSVGIAGYENVTSVELKAIALPKVANERYVVMSVAELNDNVLDATTSAVHDSFAIVYFDSDTLATGAVKPLKGADFYQKQFVYRPPLARLNSMSIRFLKHDGNVVTTADTNGEAHVSMLFEVTCRNARSG
jgi:hypothetical protein